jgi:hypothetical protein
MADKIEGVREAEAQLRETLHEIDYKMRSDLGACEALLPKAAERMAHLTGTIATSPAAEALDRRAARLGRAISGAIEVGQTWVCATEPTERFKRAEHFKSALIAVAAARVELHNDIDAIR